MAAFRGCLPPPCGPGRCTEGSGAARGVLASGGSCVCGPPAGLSPAPAADGCFPRVFAPSLRTGALYGGFRSRPRCSRFGRFLCLWASRRAKPGSGGGWVVSAGVCPLLADRGVVRRVQEPPEVFSLRAVLVFVGLPP